MFLLAVHLERSLETTSKSVERGEEGIDASFLFLGIHFFGDTLLRGLTVLSAFTLVVAPADPEVFVPEGDVAKGEGASSLASGIAIAAAFAFSS